jgi:hypothetical protein
MRSVTIWVEDGVLKLRMPYDEIAVADFKDSFCSDWRSYNKKTTVWSLIITQQARLEDFCRRHFGKIIYLGELPPASEMCAYVVELADLIWELPDELVKKVYQLLIFETHPDRGGDADLARRVNDAFRKL